MDYQIREMLESAFVFGYETLVGLGVDEEEAADILQQVRERDKALAGSVNPMLADFGRGSEAAQYSGREVGPDWKCPFTPQEPLK